MSDSTPPAAPPSNDAYAQPGAAAGKLNGLAVASLVVGIVGVTFVLSFYGIPGLVALILGIVSRRQIKATGQRGAGFALAGIILGAIGIVIGILSIILASAVVANMNK
ncbi:uncharacterized protein DUF4190 [Frondihabitans sp. PhB188]|uniref:DUF4190 domain-containing protein n=1 Tax=Frondihabitans sp. PhB188 TaxID=2485200 RepID=UPI000F9BAF3C|nr:DUF4190 domain-containing protein [Frondihabitans sp. PhB188]ROQ37444.1 uncharacterized protein DUF4190 [Frondihabitans sp. PhB188]